MGGVQELSRAHVQAYRFGGITGRQCTRGIRRAGSRAQAETRNGDYVSGNFFRTLGVQPWIGRLMTDMDDQEGASSVAVMSYRI